MHSAAQPAPGPNAADLAAYSQGMHNISPAMNSYHQRGLIGGQFPHPVLRAPFPGSTKPTYSYHVTQGMVHLIPIFF